MNMEASTGQMTFSQDAWTQPARNAAKTAPEASNIATRAE